jgi:Ankyrin repeats (3 copies)
MSTNFNCCDSVSRYVRNTGAEDVCDRITNETTPEEFEQIRKEFPRFQLWHPCCNHETVLHEAAKKANVPLIKYLVKQAPELLERGAGGNEFTPLSAAFHGGYDAMQTLLELGANPNTMDNTPISCLQALANIQLSQLKKQGSMPMGADLTLSNKINKTAQAIKLLLKYGAERQPEDDQVSYMDLPRIKSLIHKASQEVAEERRKEQRQTYDAIFESNVLLPSDVCNLVSQFI